MEDHPGPKVKVADSLKEYRHWLIRQADSRAGRIQGLQCGANQRSFPLVVNGILITRYRADFTFIRDGALVVEDVKGFRTDKYKLKKLLMKAVYGIDIVEI